MQQCLCLVTEILADHLNFLDASVLKKHVVVLYVYIEVHNNYCSLNRSDTLPSYSMHATFLCLLQHNYAQHCTPFSVWYGTAILHCAQVAYYSIISPMHDTQRVP